MPFPDIDPILIQIGPFAVRWYALAYIAGLLLGWRYCLMLTNRPPQAMTREQLDDFLVWATIGVVIGGRLGYVVFYQPGYFLAHPIEIPQMWKGGMSFHGGFLGLLLATYAFARRHGIEFWSMTDLIAASGPIGLFFGRIANFINGELWGRTTDVAWGVIFPRGGPLPRHPSQLYEAVLEGLLLTLVAALLIYRFEALRRPGMVFGTFLAGYGLARIVVETAREPDAFIGYLVGGTTWGQWLSLPMVFAGLYLIRRARRRTPAA
jgi:phosphatidylglycerol:prolipoprotein diacylglycerol transferase